MTRLAGVGEIRAKISTSGRKCSQNLAGQLQFASILASCHVCPRSLLRGCIGSHCSSPRMPASCHPNVDIVAMEGTVLVEPQCRQAPLHYKRQPHSSVSEPPQSFTSGETTTVLGRELTSRDTHLTKYQFSKSLKPMSMWWLAVCSDARTTTKQALHFQGSWHANSVCVPPLTSDDTPSSR